MKIIPKAKSSISISVITFIEGSSVLDNKGLATLDSLGKYLRCNEELLDKGVVVFIPYNTQKEFNSNTFIGIERYRTVNIVLAEKFKIDTKRKVFYKDKFFEENSLFRGETGLICHFLLTQ